MNIDTNGLFLAGSPAVWKYVQRSDGTWTCYVVGHQDKAVLAVLAQVLPFKTDEQITADIARLNAGEQVSA